MKKAALILIATLMMIGINACKKEKPIAKGFHSDKNTVLFGCEGNFTWGNASVGVCFSTSDSIWNDAYSQINQEKLGDVLQSMTLINDRIFFVMNNSNKIVVCTSDDLLKVTEIEGLQSPRYIVDAMNGSYYVSDLYANAVTIVDAKSYTITGTMPCVGWSESMVYANGKVYIGNMKSHFLYVANTSSNSITDSIDIGYGTSSMIKDKNNRLWITTSGRPASGIPASLLCLDIEGVHPMIHQRFNFTAGAPKSLQVNSLGDQLIFLNVDVYAMSILDSSLPSTPIVSASGSNIYSIAVNPLTDDIYVADAKDYVQSGKVSVYSKSGVLTQDYITGIIPSSFLFFY